MTAARAGAASLLVALGVAGCGGAGSGPGVAPATAGAGSPTAATATVQVTIRVPAAPGALADRRRAPLAGARSPRYVSPGTKSATVVVTPQSGTAGAPTVIGCSNGVCTGQVNAPIGSDAFTVKLYDAANGTGSLLSTGSLTQTIVPDSANSVRISFDGVVAALSLALSPATVTQGSAQTVSVTFAALDADGYTILGPYVDASGALLTVTLSDSDTSGATALSPTTLTGSPATPPALRYDGASIPNPTIAANAPGVTRKTALLTIARSAAASALYVAEGPPTQGTGAVVEYAPPYSASSAPVLDVPEHVAFYDDVAADAQYLAYADGSTISIYPQPFSPGQARIAALPVKYGPDGHFVFDSAGNMWVSDANGFAIDEFTPPFLGGIIASRVIPAGSYPSSLAVGSDGTVYALVAGVLTTFAPPYTTSTAAITPGGNGYFAGVAAFGNELALTMGNSQSTGGAHRRAHASKRFARSTAPPWTADVVLLYRLPLTASSTPYASIPVPSIGDATFDTNGDLFVVGNGGIALLEPPLSSSTTIATTITKGAGSANGVYAGPLSTVIATPAPTPTPSPALGPNLYVADGGSGLLKYVPPFSASSQPVARVAGGGAGYIGAAADDDYVATMDFGSLNVYLFAQPFTSSSKPVVTTAGLMTADTGAQLAFDRSGKLWTATNGNEVAEFAPPFTNGMGPSFVSSDFHATQAVSIDPSFTVYVVDDSKSGATIDAMPLPYYNLDPSMVAPAPPPGSQFGLTGIAVAGNKLFVGDAGNLRICVYDLPLTSTSLPSAIFPGPPGIEGGYYYYSLAVDAAGNLYVGDGADFGINVIAAQPRARRRPAGGGTQGGIYVYRPPFTSSSTPAFEITNGVSDVLGLNFGP